MACRVERCTRPVGVSEIGATLMSSGVEPQGVQKALRHANLRITLETHVHSLPKKDRPRDLVGDLLRKAGSQRREAPACQARS
ncbi:hypothetical protein CA850_10220 [Micromonospora echinospora]|nr:hypothetical protein CA850_10220 [Micromonospora echinospora]